MPLLKGNLHAHTTFSDGHRPVAEVLERYRELGYHFLAITDHVDRVGDDYWFNIPSGGDDLIVLPGIELDYRPLSQHVGKVTGDRETLHVLNHPARYGLSVRQILDRIREITEAGLPIDAIEITDTGVYQAQHDVERIQLPKIATDDSHRDAEFGRAWVEVDAARSPDAIIRAIKAGDFLLGFASTPGTPEGHGFDLLGLAD
jgi:predicted metal-dependent phosphoesterase TrpH